MTHNSKTIISDQKQANKKCYDSMVLLYSSHFEKSYMHEN